MYDIWLKITDRLLKAISWLIVKLLKRFATRIPGFKFSYYGLYTETIFKVNRNGNIKTNNKNGRHTQNKWKRNSSADPYIGGFKLITIVQTWDGGFALWHYAVVHNVVGQQAVICVCWLIGVVFWFQSIQTHNTKYFHIFFVLTLRLTKDLMVNSTLIVLFSIKSNTHFNFIDLAKVSIKLIRTSRRLIKINWLLLWDHALQCDRIDWSNNLHCKIFVKQLNKSAAMCKRQECTTEMWSQWEAIYKM